MSTEQKQTPFQKALTASPLGVVALIAGLIFAIGLLFKFNALLDNVENDDLNSAIQVIEITVVSIWFAVALWGWYLIRDGFERTNTRRRLKEQAELLARIQETVEERDVEKAKKVELTQKSRSFWNWRRNES